MIIILGLIILVAAVVVGVAGVLGNGGTHGLAHGFSVLGYHVTGSGTVFLYGIIVGAVALFGLWLLLAGARHTSRRGRAARRGLSAVPARDRPVPPGDRRGQQGPRRADRPARHRPRLHRQHPGQRRAFRQRRAYRAWPLNPSQDGGRRGRPRLFGRRAALRQSATAPAEAPAGQPAPGVPAGAPAPAEQPTNGSHP